MDMDIVWLGFFGSLVAGLMTAVGAAGVYFVRQLSPKLEDALLSFAAGIMLAASFFSLLLPAIEYGELQFESKGLAVAVVIIGFLAGAAVLFYLHRHLPHEHFLSGHEGPDAKAFKRIWLFVIAIALHNFPEGMAVGSGFANGDIANGTSLATGIGIQNIPEGLAVAVAMIAIGYSRMQGFMVAALTGLAEPVGGLFGSLAVSLAGPVMPLALAFSAGAMLFIISDEIIPETHRRGFESIATFSLIIGFACMMYLDATLA
ncbi:zinc transporter, ZIP family [Mariprofundus ferrinatatus]|uniref:Zinc transporter, ZIP family n=1 Tax=Mariprofundus ferrinatatus TaxID=1921087 RepID=A0A2K8L2G5_9PROT|nr:ZIP family metal transporter [Mariprofundus ferrinatatus]ATX81292.1 zinc transporter, ZIP family [Mariprofundus ferrinatatus]